MSLSSPRRKHPASYMSNSALPRPSTSLSVNALRTTPVTAISSNQAAPPPTANAVSSVPTSARVPEAVQTPASWTKVPLAPNETQRQGRPQPPQRQEDDPPSFCAGSPAFSRNSFTISSFQRPMCRICHSCRGFVNNSSASTCASAGILRSGHHQSPPPPAPLRSATSVLSAATLSTLSGQTMEDEEGGRPRDLGRLIAPCLCDGSLKYVHEVCVQQWIAVSHSTKCELCHFPFCMKRYTKPLKKWEKLPLTTMERRRLICSVTFHVLALVTIIWSLFVLIERVIAEVQEQNMGWAFWTKLLVIAIGIGGGLIYTYIQWRLYVDLLIRWRDHNRVLVVQVPTKEALKAERNQRASVGHEGQQNQPPPPGGGGGGDRPSPGNLSDSLPPQAVEPPAPSSPPLSRAAAAATGVSASSLQVTRSGSMPTIYTIFPVLPSPRPPALPPPS